MRATVGISLIAVLVGLALMWAVKDPMDSSELSSPVTSIYAGRSSKPVVIAPSVSGVRSASRAWSDGLAHERIGDVVLDTSSPVEVMGRQVYTYRRLNGDSAGVISVDPSGAVAGVLFDEQGHTFSVSGTVANTEVDLQKPSNPNSPYAPAQDDTLLATSDSNLRHPLGRNLTQSLSASSAASGTKSSTRRPDIASPSSSGSTIQVAFQEAESSLTLVMGYTQRFQDLAGGTPAAAENRIIMLVALGNQALSNSQVNQRVDLVSIIKVPYSETESASKALNDITPNMNARPDSRVTATMLATERSRLGADAIGMIRPYTASAISCGVAWLNGSNGLSMEGYTHTAAFVVHNLVEPNLGGAYCDDFGLIHELGHVMGQDHDQLNAPGWPTSAHSRYGFGSTGFGPEGGFSDVMGYPGGVQVRVPYFSNPRLTTQCKGGPCGTTFADTALSLGEVRHAVSAWGNYRGGQRLVPNNTGTIDVAFTGVDPLKIHRVVASTPSYPNQSWYIGPTNDPTVNDPFDSLDGTAGALSRQTYVPGNQTQSAITLIVDAGVHFPNPGEYKIFAGMGDTVNAATVVCQAARQGDDASCSWIVTIPPGAPSRTAWLVVQGISGITGNPQILSEFVARPTASSPEAVAFLGDHMVASTTAHVTFNIPSLAVSHSLVFDITAYDQAGVALGVTSLRLVRYQGVRVVRNLGETGVTDATVAGRGVSRLTFEVPNVQPSSSEQRMYIRRPENASVNMYLMPPKGTTDTGRYPLRQFTGGMLGFSFVGRQRIPGTWTLVLEGAAADPAVRVPVTVELMQIAKSPRTPRK